MRNLIEIFSEVDYEEKSWYYEHEREPYSTLSIFRTIAFLFGFIKYPTERKKSY